MKSYIFSLLKNLAHPMGIVGLVVSVVVPFLVYLGPNVGQKNLIRQLDLDLPLPLFLVQLLLAVVLVALLHKDFREWFLQILPAKKWSILMAVFTVAVTIFAATQIDARHRVQSDESVFFSVAQNMYHNFQSGTCNQGYFENGNLKCIATSNSFKTKGLSFLYLLGMPLLGSDLHWTFYLELFMLPLAMLIMFLAIAAWTKQPLLAFFASLLMALQPTVLFQFRSMSVEPLYIFLSALSLFVFKYAYDRNTLKHWALFAITLAFFAQTRQETVFCLLPFILFSLPKLLDSKSAKAPTFFVLLSVFSIPVLLTISYFQGFNFQGGEFSAHGHFFEDLAKNWEVMTKPLNQNGELVNPFLTYFNYLFAVGCLYLLVRSIVGLKNREFFFVKILVFLVLYHIQTYMILENVSGDFTIEINQRYSLVMLPSMAFVAALPIAYLVNLLAKSMGESSQKLEKLGVVIAVIVALIFTGWTFHYKSDFNKNVMYNRNHLTTEEHEILDWLNLQPVRERLFVYARPWHFVGYGISSIHYDKVRQMSNDDLKKLIDKYQGEVYYIRGLDCWDSKTYHKKAVEHRIPTTCDIFEREMDLEGVKNILITNNYWVQIAKFNGRKEYNVANIIEAFEPKLLPLNAGKADSTNGSDFRIGARLLDTSNQSVQWTFNVFVNDKNVLKMPYSGGIYDTHYDVSNLLPGYNSIVYNVVDSSKNKILTEIQKTYFYRVNGATPLTDLTYESHSQGWGTWHINQSIDGNTFKVGAKNYTYGIGTHAPSTTVYNIKGEFKSFSAIIGLDEESLCSDGIKFQILGDGQILYDSPELQLGKAYPIYAKIENVKKLTLISLPLETNNCDHVDIINPALLP